MGVSGIGLNTRCVQALEEQWNRVQLSKSIAPRVPRGQIGRVLRLACHSAVCHPRESVRGCMQVRIDARSSYRVPSPLVGEGQSEGTRAAARSDLAIADARKCAKQTRTVEVPLPVNGLFGACQRQPPHPVPLPQGERGLCRGALRQFARCVHPLARKRGSRANGRAVALDSRFRGNDKVVVDPLGTA